MRNQGFIYHVLSLDDGADVIFLDTAGAEAFWLDNKDKPAPKCCWLGGPNGKRASKIIHLLDTTDTDGAA